MVTVRDQGHPPNSYRVVFDRGSALMGVGQCVLCMHGEGTYVYVARGRVRLLGESANAGPAQMLTADGSIGVLEKDGTMRVRASFRCLTRHPELSPGRASAGCERLRFWPRQPR